MAERCARFTGVVKLLCRRTYSTSLPVQITCYRSQLLTSKQQPRHRACTTAATAYDALVESLEEKGVVNSLSTESVRRLSRICYGPKIVVAALMRYKEIYRDLLVPTAFVVPDGSDAWPEEVWGMKLGRVVSSIRHGNHYKYMREMLESIGFEYCSQLNRRQFELVKEALLLYKELHGHMKVPVSFIVTEKDDIWPFEFWNLRLGKAVLDINAGCVFKFQRQELVSIGFEFTGTTPGRKYNDIKDALICYKSEYSDMLVPQAFVVPSKNDIWPEHTWGLKLGRAVSNLRRGANYKYMREDLEEIGFDFNLRVSTYGYEHAKEALLRYQELYGNMLVPAKFVVPAQTEIWPEKLWGMKLGDSVRNIRRGAQYLYAEEELLQIGFVYTNRGRNFLRRSARVDGVKLENSREFSNIFPPH